MKKLIWRCWMIVAVASVANLSAAEFRIGVHNFTLPDGFEIELIAGTNLVPRPIEADFDEQGRLYVTDSSGSNDKIQKQLEDKPHRVLQLEDTDGDGHFDKSITFADKMMFPEGAMWLDGSLYVAAPPSIWKLTDTNSDGIADVRVEWFKGETLTGCANDLHGPYAGPDGWIYWCKGAFAKQTYTLANGEKFTTRASHIFRARPDGRGIEPVMTGGMDNPVGLAFTPEGERIFSCTFFQHPANGQRDGLIHAIYGGVYGKIHDVIDEHPRTGDVMPVMTHLGPAAPAGLMRYESDVFGKDYQNNLFTACFNLHKITRHVLEPSGATYKTRDSDFLVSDNTDFHPTDVFEDADGSLVVIDTGGWYKLCCPTSQLHKPDVLGGIYRVRRKGAPRVDDPRGEKIRWTEASPEQITSRFGDRRPVVRRRAIAEAGKRVTQQMSEALQVAMTNGTSAEVRRDAVWASSHQWLGRQLHSEAAMAPALDSSKPDIERAQTLGKLNTVVAASPAAALHDKEPSVVLAALNVLSATDLSSGPDRDLLHHRSLPVQRAAIAWRGRCQEKELANIILAADLLPLMDNVVDRVHEHSIIYALIELNEPSPARKQLRSQSASAVRIALIALDQMRDGALKPHEVTPHLLSTNVILKDTATWIVSRHGDWGESLATFFRERLHKATLVESERAELQQQLEHLARTPAIQKLLIETFSGTNKTAHVVALRALARSGVKEMPDEWVSPLTNCLRQTDRSIATAAIAAVRALPRPKAHAEALNAALLDLAERSSSPPSLRIAAAATVSGGIKNLSEPLYSRLIATLVQDSTIAERTDAANALARARLSNARLLELAAHMKRVGPMELPRVLPAFAQGTNEMVGLKLIESLQASKSAQGLRAETLKPAVTNFPASVQQRADLLLASLNTDAAAQKAHLDELLASAKDGDVRRGQALFNDAKTACSACHAIGYLGGNVGPDLTRIGQVRNERDLLEAIIYPSVSFVRSYEPVIVTTKSGDEFSGVLKKDAADEVLLLTGPNAEQRLARAEVADMRPGTVSVMPSGLADQLSKQEVADLLAFLKATRW